MANRSNSIYASLKTQEVAEGDQQPPGAMFTPIRPPAVVSGVAAETHRGARCPNLD